MRGKENLSIPKDVSAGITPAYAGKSHIYSSFESAWRDHPRLCGEKGGIVPANGSRTGSPPPMRGKENRGIHCKTRHRITPAYAGKSRVIGRSDDTKKDHPRLCGEKFVGEMLRKIVEGSPPPMRGKVSKCPPVDFFHRITPAYAGKRAHSTHSGN